MKYRGSFLILFMLLFVACTPPEEPGDDGIVTDSDIDQGEEVTFPDPAFAHCVRVDLLKEDNEPVYVSEVSRWTVLGCSGAGITDITGIEYMTNLVYIDLYSNQIVSLEPLRNLKKVKELDLDDNQITSLDPILGFTELESLSFQSNNVTSLHELGNLKKLTEILLNNNNIDSLDGLQSLPVLEYLTASRNNISDISALTTITTLKTLLIDDNKITSLDAIEPLLSLERLAIEMNCIVDFSPIEYLKTNGVLTNVTGDTAEEQQNCTLVNHTPTASRSPL